MSNAGFGPVFLEGSDYMTPEIKYIRDYAERARNRSGGPQYSQHSEDYRKDAMVATRLADDLEAGLHLEDEG